MRQDYAYQMTVIWASTNRMFFLSALSTHSYHCFNNANELWSEIYLNFWQNSNKSLLDCFKSQRQSLMQTYSIIKSHLELVQVCYTYEIKSPPCIFMAIDLSAQFLKGRLNYSVYLRISKANNIAFAVIPCAGKWTAFVWGQQIDWIKKGITFTGRAKRHFMYCKSQEKNENVNCVFNFYVRTIKSRACHQQ